MGLLVKLASIPLWLRSLFAEPAGLVVTGTFSVSSQLNNSGLKTDSNGDELGPIGLIG
jgi:hypothetical protein